MITLLTDFGTRDYFVPAVKGVILGIHPQARIIDLTHEIAPQDIAAAAYTLGACYHHFPAGTVHLAVVDPGVGSARRGIAVEAGAQLLVGPDNGIFSYVYLRESRVRVFHLTRAEYFRQPVSPTFHGRDLFAPVAARLARGVAIDDLGEEIVDYRRLEISRPQVHESRGLIEGRIIHIDRFGNCVTNLTAREFSPGGATRMHFAGRVIDRFGTHYAQAESGDELLAYPGSAGYWEIAVWCGSAAALTGAEVGAAVVIELGPA
ncbi:MAG TPA: SAM-dependent chlorinase/fluorinase [Blastocatellia bacterium]|nr:SAM-dependent chlorinase/fluorinase [Blastocatellia bacterium]